MRFVHAYAVVRLYGFTQEIGATKSALGHHRDDRHGDKFFLNLFHGGSKAMPQNCFLQIKRIS